MLAGEASEEETATSGATTQTLLANGQELAELHLQRQRVAQSFATDYDTVSMSYMPSLPGTPTTTAPFIAGSVTASHHSSRLEAGAAERRRFTAASLSDRGGPALTCSNPEGCCSGSGPAARLLLTAAISQEQFPGRAVGCTVIVLFIAAAQLLSCRQPTAKSFEAERRHQQASTDTHILT
jgi:hypothetical protein